jgi:replicative DNA helicase
VQTAAERFAAYLERKRRGEHWRHYKTGEGVLDDLGIGPGRVVLFGGDTANGKSSLVWQLMIEALRYNPTLRMVVYSYDLPEDELFGKQLARLASVDVDKIREGTTDARDQKALDDAAETLMEVFQRVRIMGPNTTIGQLTNAVGEFGANLVFVDYVQKVKVGDLSADIKKQVEVVLDELNRLAKGKNLTAVVSISKLSRPGFGTNQNGHRFAETSDLEYGCDDAYIVEHDKKKGTVTLRHTKERFGIRNGLVLDYIPKYQQFHPRRAS